MNSDKCANRPWMSQKINMIQYWTPNCNHMQCERSQLWSNDDRSVYKKQCCQLLAKLSCQSGWKIRLLPNLTFWRHLGGWKFCFFVAKCQGKVLICRELERISCVRPLFLFGSFLSYVTEQSASWQHRSCINLENALQPIASREIVLICSPPIRNFRRWHCCINEQDFCWKCLK